MSLNPSQRAAQEQFDRQSRNYGRSHILADTSDITAALGDLLDGNGRSALDIATGGGHTAVLLASHGWRVTASDLSSAMLERTAELAAESGVTVETVQHEAESLPYSDAAFDLVTCRTAAHHFSSPTAFVQQTFRVLKPGGHFLLIDGAAPDGNPDAARWINAVEKLRDPSHGCLRTPSDWIGLCEAAGFEILDVKTSRLKQPDLEWYFETAATTPENRNRVLELIDSAPPGTLETFELGHEDGKIVWWWSRLALLARRVA